MLATVLTMTNIILPAILSPKESAVPLPPTQTPSITPLPKGSPTLLPITQPATPALTENIPLVWEPLPPISQENYVLITNGNRLDNKIALTFDACQTYADVAGYDTEIIRILNETNTPATIFLGGLWMQYHQEATIELANNPLFELGNHSWSHPDFSELSNDEITEEIQKTQEEMYTLVGFQTNLFRLPFGTYTEETLKTIAGNGLYTIQWDVESGDPDPNINAEDMIDWVLYQAQAGSIIIMHVNGRGWHTAEALPTIIANLREQGYEFVTISELLGLE